MCHETAVSHACVRFVLIAIWVRAAVRHPTHLHGAFTLKRFLFGRCGRFPRHFFAAMATVAEMKALISEKVDSDLSYIWSDCEVDLVYQYRMAQKKITTMARFAALE